jgi:hypothetical protein
MSIVDFDLFAGFDIFVCPRAAGFYIMDLANQNQV